jgi:NAD+ synthase (glutamine-hydrolysing)
MQLIRVAAGVLNQTPLDWQGNKDRIVAAIDEARKQGASILCLPELCITGYGCEDTFHSPATARTAWSILQELLPQTTDMIVSLGLPVLYQNGLFNCACLVVNGKILGFTAKRFLAGDGIHYEPRWYKAWPGGVRAELHAGGQIHPIGDLLFDVGGVKIGFEICEDAWVATRPGADLSRQGADVILNPSASHFAFGKVEVRKQFVQEGSRAFGVTYIYSNLVGNESGRAIYDGGALIASAGRLVAAGPRFTFKEVSVSSAVVDLDATRMNQARTGSFNPRVAQSSGGTVEGSFTFPPLEPQENVVQHEPWETGPDAKNEEFLRAETLALFDYMRKSRSTGFVVSLSGGADSSSIACLAGFMVECAVRELGEDGFRKRLAYIKDLPKDGGVKALVGRLLVCAYQATENSGQVTRNAARAVAEAVGAQYHELDVDPLLKGYLNLIGSAIGRPLNWKQDDTALQNIQARVRGPSVWLLANIRGALLLTTSNRSEAAVGYATMDGDTCGGLAPLGGIDKAFLRRWLVWLEKQGPHGLYPIPALKFVNEQQPTAELRPADCHQTDEDDLMPYEVLDAIERAAIRDKLSPVEIFHVLRRARPQDTPKTLVKWIERFFRLWCRNQWKRERYAPSFHLDDENLDPKTWCRFPILSGGYERELSELRAFVAGL